MTLNLHVKRGVSHHHLHFVVAEKAGQHVRFERVSADDAMDPEDPDIVFFGYDTFRLKAGASVAAKRIGFGAVIDDDVVDLAGRKSRQLDIDIQPQKIHQLDFQAIGMPFAVLGDFGVRQDQRLLFGLGQAGEGQCRYLSMAKSPESSDAGMAKQDRLEFVDNDGFDQAEARYASGQLVHLLVGMDPGVPGKFHEHADRHHNYLIGKEGAVSAPV
ncbi:MAG: hypothetical protein J0I19_16090 [Alphaproteobacteria bacterium]|nr:hypothetical protein [Alphaproteobacteria bacterium]